MKQMLFLRFGASEPDFRWIRASEEVEMLRAGKMRRGRDRKAQKKVKIRK
jgi:hypothetical protein